MRILAIICMLCFATGNWFNACAQEARTVVYLIPGQGADERQFDLLNIDPRIEVRHIEYFTPEKGWKMHEFAEALAQQIDTTGSYWIVGISLGGMLASEMGDFLNPEKIILISSAKSRRELPGRYTFQKYIPLHVLIPPKLTKGGAKMLQPIVEPDSRSHKEFFREMLNDKDPLFLKRTVAMIIGWERKEKGGNIIHIHGDKDHTIPVKNVDYDYLIEGGSHMMVYTRADEISAILNKILLHKTN
jgi:pimeloyl-ACP methyl ester carboxylesterase